MKRKMVTAAAIGLVIGLVAWSCLRQSEAQGQGGGQAKLACEYKVVMFSGVQVAETQANIIDNLAVEGWEYVGLLCAGSQAGPQGSVLFKRPKR